MLYLDPCPVQRRLGMPSPSIIGTSATPPWPNLGFPVLPTNRVERDRQNMNDRPTPPRRPLAIHEAGFVILGARVQRPCHQGPRFHARTEGFGKCCGPRTGARVAPFCPTFQKRPNDARRRARLRPRAPMSARKATWLILPVVICLSQRLSHASVSMNEFRP